MYNLIAVNYVIIIFLIKISHWQVVPKCRAENIIPVFKKDGLYHSVYNMFKGKIGIMARYTQPTAWSMKLDVSETGATLSG